MRSGLAFFAAVVVASAVGCPKEAPKSYAPPRDYSLYLTRYPFGGQTLEWWQERVRDLSPGGKSADPTLLALTVDRARKNGLVVGDDGVVKVSPELTTHIIARMEADEAQAKAATTTPAPEEKK